jgi:hypothetical protein
LDLPGHAHFATVCWEAKILAEDQYLSGTVIDCKNPAAHSTEGVRSLPRDGDFLTGETPWVAVNIGNRCDSTAAGQDRQGQRRQEQELFAAVNHGSSLVILCV